MVDREAVRRGYDDLGELYAAGRSETGYDVDILDQFFASVPESARILDAGCGPGTPILRELSTRATAIGLDFSNEQLRLASANAPQSSLICGDMTALPVRSDVFDAIVALHSLIHVSLDDRRTVIDEFARVLRPGGRLLLSEGPNEWTGSNPDWLDSGVEMQWSIAGVDATRDHLRTAGFTVTEEWETQSADEDGEHWVFLAARLEASGGDGRVRHNTA